MKLLVNGTPADTATYPEQTNSSTGFDANGTLSWNLWFYASGEYNVTLVASDSLGHSTTFIGIHMRIANPLYRYAPNIVFWALLGIVGVWYVWKSRRQRHRLMDRYAKRQN